MKQDSLEAGSPVGSAVGHLAEGLPAVDAMRGLEVLRSLASASPDAAARLILRDVEDLEVATAEDIVKSDVYHLIGVQSSASLEERRQLVHSVVKGAIEGLSAEERKKLFRVGQHLRSTLSDDPAKAVAGEAKEPSPLLQNLILLSAVAAHGPPSGPGDTGVLVQSASDALITCAVGNPQLVADILKELDEELDEETRVRMLQSVPEGQRETISKALKPGGYADQLSWSIRTIHALYEHRWWFALFPIVELVLSFTLEGYCYKNATNWLFADSVLLSVNIWAVYRVCECFSAVLGQLRHDARSALDGLRKAASSHSLAEAAGAMGMALSELECARRCGILIVVLLCSGALWALLGGLYLVLSILISSCSLFSWIFLSACVCVRLMSILWIVGVLQRAWEDLSSLTGALGAGQPSYGGTGSADLEAQHRT